MVHEHGPSGAAAAADAAGPYDRFRLATTAGNDAFCAGDHARAQMHYDKAVRLARHLFQWAVEDRFCPRRAADLLLVARQNAASNLLRVGRLAEAGAQLEAGCRAMCDWRCSPHAPAALRDACDERLPFALHLCLAHLERAGAGPERIAALYLRASQPPPSVPAG